ncbi:hypothetical protein RJ639_014356 [Escallonia herrerae]|uniref:BHLH domain-containing protein n=1 Tax=Escallonia herrerae TaxID=1293975 RepID=A0AA88VIY7_9ASTE|nr:hypothetical protein RJ639_014356 [Escallonia herrerae]
MEHSQHGLLEELLAPRREDWTTFQSELVVNEFFPSGSGWSFESYDRETLELSAVSNHSFLELITSPVIPCFECPLSGSGTYPLFQDGFAAPDFASSREKKIDLTPLPNSLVQGDRCNASMVEDGEFDHLGSDLQSLEERSSSCKVETEQSTFNVGLSVERKNKNKKVEGQPSKNLMAERRRRKRLNDRLSMLRSIVPKISKVIISVSLSLILKTFSRLLATCCIKETFSRTNEQMDRTSILGDTIDYMKELLDKIHNLQEEDRQAGVRPMNLVGNLKQLDVNEQTRNPPKVNIFCITLTHESVIYLTNSPKIIRSQFLQFDVERRNIGTRIEICCAAKPGLLLSTVHTLEALGLDINQCVLSCFSDFSLRASCFEAVEHQTMITSEDIKQALFRNAGYGGRCL